MDSTGSISTLAARAMPLLAILRHDLRSLAASWLVRLWLVGSVLMTLVVLMGNWSHMQTAPLIASLAIPYLVFPWFLVVMVLGVTPVSGTRVEALADGFLSRPLMRHEYLLGVWAARVLVTLAGYLVVMFPAAMIVWLANRPVTPDRVTFFGVVASLGVVALVLVFQVSLAFLLGILLRKPLLAIVVLLFFWYPVDMLLHTFRLEAFSPITLNQALPTLLRQPWSLGGGDVERPDADLEALSQQMSGLMGMFGGEAPKPRERKVPFFEEQFPDFSLTRVVLGYGLSSVAAISLALFWFARRDL